MPDNIKHSPPAGLILFHPSEEEKYVMLKLELQKSLQDLLYYVRNPLSFVFKCAESSRWKNWSKLTV